jgi:hypothetical protein
MQILSVIVQDINAATIPKYSAKFRKAGMFMLTLFDLRKIMRDIDINLHKKLLDFEIHSCLIYLKMLIHCWKVCWQDQFYLINVNYILFHNRILNIY